MEEYIQTQFDHHAHSYADGRAVEKLRKYQFHDPNIDLSLSRFSAHGQFAYNLHLVFVHHQRWRSIDDACLAATREMVVKVAAIQEYLLKSASFLSDHLHLSIGCSMDDSPDQIALKFMNNLAYAAGKFPIYQAGCFIGTFGEYDIGAVSAETGIQETP